MHPIDSILQEYGMSKYAFQKQTGIKVTRLSNNVVRNTAVDNLSMGLLHAMSRSFGISMDEVYAKLKAYESKRD